MVPVCSQKTRDDEFLPGVSAKCERGKNINDRYNHIYLNLVNSKCQQLLFKTNSDISHNLQLINSN